MKRKIFTFLLCSAVGFTYAHKSTVATDPTIFGKNDVLIADFEDGGKTPIITDSLWADTAKTTINTLPSADLRTNDNPNPESDNTSQIVGDYSRPAGGYKSLYIRLDNPIDFAKTPYFQFMIYPLSGKSPVNGSKVEAYLMNDKNEVASIQLIWQNNIAQDKWTTVTGFLARNKSNVKYNAIQILINSDDSTSNVSDTEYYIDQIGFKAPADGVALRSTIFYENFGNGWLGSWNDGKVYKQIGGERGYAAQYDSIGGFTSGIHFTNKDIAADTTSILWARAWGMGANYASASGGARLGLTAQYNSTLESGNIDVSGMTDLNLGFGFGTQEWWGNWNIPSARPMVQISVDGGDFYQLSSPSEFLLAKYDTIRSLIDGSDSIINTTWNYQDQLFKWVDYPFTAIDGVSPLPAASKVNIRLSYGAGCNSWVDDMWFSGRPVTGTGVSNPKTDDAFKVYPNPATKYITTPNAQKVTIIDLNGRLVQEVFNTEKVDVSTLAKGAYIVKVKVNGFTKIGKLIKE
jgi:hypothetical protein